MKTLILCLCLLVAGCQTDITFPDGTRYHRLGNQQIGHAKFTSTDANGVKIELEIWNQKSITELALEAAGFKVSTKGGSE